MTHFIYENTWQENCELFKTKKVAVIPVGSNEQHGPALPTGTDWMLAEYLGREVGKKSKSAVVTPVIPIGHATYHADFPGTLAVSTATLAAYVREICEDLISYGITHILFLNGHGGNNTALYDVGQELRLRGIPVANIQWFDIAGTFNPEWGLRGHGDITETSAMMHVFPEGVKLEKAHLPENRHLGKIKVLDLHTGEFEGASVYLNLRTKDCSEQGDLIEYGHGKDLDYSVSACASTAELGKECLDACVDYICRFIEEFKTISFDS